MLIRNVLFAVRLSVLIGSTQPRSSPVSWLGNQWTFCFRCQPAAVRTSEPVMQTQVRPCPVERWPPVMSQGLWLCPVEKWPLLKRPWTVAGVHPNNNRGHLWASFLYIPKTNVHFMFLLIIILYLILIIYIALNYSLMWMNEWMFNDTPTQK